MTEIDYEARTYLRRRAREIFHSKDDAARVVFGLDDDPFPRNADELVRRITDGQYIITDQDQDNTSGYMCPLNFFRFRNPDKKPDKTGYETLMKQLRELGQRAEDVIMVKNTEEGLKAIQEMEAFPVQ